MECAGGSGGGGLSRSFRYPCAAALSKPHALAPAPFQSISVSSLRPHLRFTNNITVYFSGCRLPPAPPSPPSPAAAQRACGAQRVGFGQNQRGRHHVTRLMRGRGRGRKGEPNLLAASSSRSARTRALLAAACTNVGTHEQQARRQQRQTSMGSGLERGRTCCAALSISCSICTAALEPSSALARCARGYLLHIKTKPTPG